LPEFIDRMERELSEREDVRGYGETGVHGGDDQGRAFILDAHKRGSTYQSFEQTRRYQQTGECPPQTSDSTGAIGQSPFQNQLRIYPDGGESGSQLYWLDDPSQSSQYQYVGVDECEPRHLFLEGRAEGLIPPHQGFNGDDRYENFANANRERPPQPADPLEILARYGMGDEETEMDWPIGPFN
jgi:hypothetical protein